jgi:hypothetical protein
VCPIARPRSVSWTYFLVKVIKEGVFGKNLFLLNEEEEDKVLKEARAPDKGDDDDVVLKP